MPQFRSLRCLWLIGLGLLVACTTAPNPTVAPVPTSHNKLGIHLLLDDGRNHWPPARWAEHLTYAQQVAGEWGYVTQLVRSDDLDVARWQQFMDLCADLHLTPILRLATTYDYHNNWWVAPEPEANGRYQTLATQYAHFIAALEWPTTPHWVIVGNEPNHGDEWSGRPDPPAYAQFLLDVAQALRSADTAVGIMNAGFDHYTPHTGDLPFANGLWYMDTESFMDEMIAAQPEVFNTLDAWASHPYPLGPFVEAPWEQTYQVDWLNGASNPAHRPPPEGVYNRGVNGYEWALWKLGTYGQRPLPVFITETGWRHGGQWPSAEQAGVYLELALWGNNGRYPELPPTGWTAWLNDPRILGITPFALDGHPDEWAHTSWLRLDDYGRVQAISPLFSHLTQYKDKANKEKLRNP